MARNHSDMHELVGAYALDALEADEVEAMELHLAECPKCRAELRDHRETAAMLAHVGAEAPTGLWDRIAAGLEEEPPDLARVFRLPTERRSSNQRWRKVAFAAAAVAAGLIAVDTAIILNDNDRPTDVEQAIAAPGSKIVALRSTDHRQSIDAVLTADGKGYVLHGKMNKLNDDQTYQLWGIVSGRSPISLGVLGQSPKEASFAAGTQFDTLAITIEKSGGSILPTGEPVLSGSVAS